MHKPAREIEIIKKIKQKLVPFDQKRSIEPNKSNNKSTRTFPINKKKMNRDRRIETQP